MVTWSRPRRSEPITAVASRRVFLILGGAIGDDASPFPTVAGRDHALSPSRTELYRSHCPPPHQPPSSVNSPRGLGHVSSVTCNRRTSGRGVPSEPRRRSAAFRRARRRRRRPWLRGIGLLGTRCCGRRGSASRRAWEAASDRISCTGDLGAFYSFSRIAQSAANG